MDRGAVSVHRQREHFLIGEGELRERSETFARGAARPRVSPPRRDPPCPRSGSTLPPARCIPNWYGHTDFDMYAPYVFLEARAWKPANFDYRPPENAAAFPATRTVPFLDLFRS